MTPEDSGRREDDAGVNAADVPDAVLWSEGMLLAPQHFQQDALRNEAAMNYRLRATRPFAWGIRKLAIDEDALKYGVFSIKELDALMPDGLILAYPHRSLDVPLEINLNDPDYAELRGAIWIHVGVAAHSSEAAANSEFRRFLSLEGGLELDENLNAHEERVARLTPRLRLYADASIRLGSYKIDSMPVGKLERVGTAVKQLDYEPPALKARKGSTFHALAERLEKDLRDKIAYLVKQQRSPLDRGLYQSGDPGDAARLLMPPLPRLAALIDSQEASPFELYLSFCDALGAAAGIDLDLAPPSATPYDHCDALPAFLDLARQIDGAISHLSPRHDLIKLDRAGPSNFRLPAGVETPEDAFILVLFPGIGQGADAISEWFLAAAIADESKIDDAILSRVRGASRRQIGWSDRARITVPRGAVAFEIAVKEVEQDAESDFLAPAGESAATRTEEPRRRLAVRHPDGAAARNEPGLICFARLRRNKAGAK